MNAGWFNELKAKVDEFFCNANEKDIETALQNANYDFYRGVTDKIVISHEETDLLFASNKHGSSVAHHETEDEVEFCSVIALTADDYNYSIAA